jgi:hypothetical protein
MTNQIILTEMIAQWIKIITAIKSVQILLLLFYPKKEKQLFLMVCLNSSNSIFSFRFLERHTQSRQPLPVPHKILDGPPTGRGGQRPQPTPGTHDSFKPSQKLHFRFRSSCSLRRSQPKDFSTGSWSPS